VTVLWGLETRLRLARLGFVTDTRGGGPDWEQFCHDLFLAGVNLILIDQPGITRDQLQAAVQSGLRAGFGSGRIIGVVQASVPAVGVDLCHLMTHERLKIDRDLFPLIGRPAESVAEVKANLADPELSYTTVGPVYEAGEPDLVRGLNLVATAAATAPVADPKAKPWFACGGVNAANFDAIVAAGARRILVHRAIAHAEDPAKTAREWSSKLRDIWRDDPALKDYSLAIRQSDRGDG
jgi:thiamine-phosphate pyrophosphorylase